METTMSKRGTFDHDGDGKPGGSRPKAERGKPMPLNRGNLERAAQLARRAAGALDTLVASWPQDDGDVPIHTIEASTGSIHEATSALADALTELGE